MERRGKIRRVPAGGEAVRVPPHDLDAERAVIGAMLVSEAAVAAVAERLAPEDFYSETHRVIYAAMMRLYARGEPIDQLTLANELQKVGDFDKVGGRAYIFQIVESVPTASNASRYAEIVRGKALLRALLLPADRLRQAEREGDYTTRLALMEEFKTYPFGAVWDYYCEMSGVPVRERWLSEVKAYERDVLAKRG